MHLYMNKDGRSPRLLLVSTLWCFPWPIIIHVVLHVYSVFYQHNYFLPLQLKAFQQKKKKKKVRPKKSTDAVSEADMSVCSEPPNLTTGGEMTGPLDSLGGKESPIPWDDFGLTSFEDDLNLPPDPLSRMSTSLPIVSTVWFDSARVLM